MFVLHLETSNCETLKPCIQEQPCPHGLGLIAQNGKFPLLVLDAALAKGHRGRRLAIREEADPAIETHGATAVHWFSLGDLSKLITTFQSARHRGRGGRTGQDKQIFSSIEPDWKLAKLLLSLGTRNTDSLIGAVAKVLADEGIHLQNSTSLPEPMLAPAGVLTRRAPSDAEQSNITYGRAVARHVARFDIGQTVVIAEAASSPSKPWKAPTRPFCAAGALMSTLHGEATP